MNVKVKTMCFFVTHNVSEVAMLGGIDRVRVFGGVQLDARGAAMIARLRSAKDDVIMRGIAEELEQDSISVVPSTQFLLDRVVEEKLYTSSELTDEEREDINVGREAILAMVGQHIGQTVVVREGVVVAVEAVEGTDRAIQRGGKLGGPGSVVVKFAKPDQDMRFDVPVVGLKTIESMIAVKASVIAVEAGRTIIVDEQQVIEKANRAGIKIIGCPSVHPSLAELYPAVA